LSVLVINKELTSGIQFWEYALTKGICSFVRQVLKSVWDCSVGCCSDAVDLILYKLVASYTVNEFSAGINRQQVE